jgi:hypothetical protein
MTAGAAGPEPGGLGSALVDVGGRFMTSPEMAAEGTPFGMEAGPLYFRGRTGIVGAPGPAVAESLLGIFPRWVIDAVWESSAAHPTADLVAAYARACAAWGRRHLADRPGAVDAVPLMERVVDAADASALPLFAGWRDAPRPDDAPARAAHLLMLLRELRGGLHFAALRAHGLDVPVAVLTDPRGGDARLRRTAWTDPDIEALRARAVAVPDRTARWAAAERSTTAAFAERVAVLEPAARAGLASLVEAADRHVRRARDSRTA